MLRWRLTRPPLDPLPKDCLHTTSGILSWGFKDRPSIDIYTMSPVPDRQDDPSIGQCHLPDTFRPCRSSRLRRFTPLRVLQVCCTLLPTMGFTLFQPVAPVLCDMDSTESSCASVDSYRRCLTARAHHSSLQPIACANACYRLPLARLASRVAEDLPKGAIYPTKCSPRQQPRRVTAPLCPLAVVVSDGS